MPVAATFRIGALAERAGVPIETIRYYEREGLLQKPERSAGGYRLYRADAVVRLTFVRRARDLGFSLEEVRSLLNLTDTKSASCDKVHALAAPHLIEVRAKLADLRRMEKALAALVTACAQGNVPECPLLSMLARPR